MLRPAPTLCSVSCLLLGFLWPATTLAGEDSWPTAVAAYQAGDLDLAIEELRTVLETHPDYAPAHHFLGAARLRSGDPPGAIESFRRAVELDAERAGYRVWLARALFQGGHLADAAREIGKVEVGALSPDDLTAVQGLLQALATRPTVAATVVEPLRRATQVTPGAPALWQALALAEEAAGALPEAFAAWTRAAQSDSNPEIRAGLLRAAIRFSQGAPEETADPTWLRRGGEVAGTWSDPPEGEAALLAAECWLGAGDCDAAGPWLEQALADRDLESRSRYYRGRCALARGDTEAALSELRTVLAASPEEELARLTGIALGEALHQAHHYLAAADAFAAAGEPARAEEMRAAHEIARANDDLETEIEECRERERHYQALFDEHRALEGTDDWAQLVRTYQEKMADCQGLL